MQTPFADQLDQVGIACLILSQQYELVGLGTNARAAGHRGAAALESELGADNRLHTLIRCRQGKLQRTEHIAGVGDRYRWHLLLLAKLDQVFDLDRTFGERIGGMDPEMDEIGVAQAIVLSAGRRVRRRSAIRPSAQ